MSSKQEFSRRKAVLKEAIVNFLDTKCLRKCCLRKNFWNDLSRFTQKTISHQHYGVSKMNNLLPEFADILYCDTQYICLRQDKSRDSEEIVVVSDSEESDQGNANNSSVAYSNSKMNRGSKGKVAPWGAGLVSTPEGSTSRKKASVDSSMEVELLEFEAPSGKGQGRAPSTPSTSGFIAFSDSTPSQDSGGTPSHQRYGLLKNPPQTSTPANSSQSGGQFMNSPVSVQAMAQNFMSQFASSVSGACQTPQTNVKGHTASPGMGLLGAIPGRPQIPQQQQQQQLQRRQHPSAHGMIPLQVAPAPGPLMAPPPQPVVSEWPRQRARTGPPAGTKITEKAPDVVVRPIRLPPGTRLTSEQVNSEVETCRELLSSAGEHVSLERLQNLVLQKYQVREFRALNLRERYFDNLQAVRDLSMTLGKVNSYIQNFVRSRSMATLYELSECCREFHQDKKSFEYLSLGPLQKMPLVYDLFKFPHDEYIPEITTMDLMEHLNQYLTKYQLWSSQNRMEDFMKYLVEEVYSVESGFSLGIRMRSLPLAIQMMKKAQRDSAATRRHIMDNLKEVLNKDVHQALTQFRASLLQTSEEGKHELRLHYLNLTPDVAVTELLTKFEMISHIFFTDASTQKKVERMQKAFQNFADSVLKVPIPRMLYHLSVCLSNLEVQESAMEFMEQERTQQQQQEAARHTAQQHTEQSRKKAPPTKAKLVEKAVTYLNKCLESGHLQLSYLQTIEAKLLEDFQFESFAEMGYGRFLELMLKEPKLSTLLEECGGTLLGSGSKGQHAECVYRPSLAEVQEILCQANHAGLTQPSQMESLLCEQYRVVNLRQLGHGSNIARLWRTAQASHKHASREQNLCYEAALCGKLGRATRPQQGQVGILGSQTRESAEACLTLCPLLEDMSAWSQWTLVFQPQFGPLREFVEKHGGQRVVSLKGKPGTTATSDFMALEVEPGKLLKICTFSSPEQFLSALEAGEPRLAAGHLVSIIATNKGVEGAPLALLANNVKTTLLSLHAQSSVLATPGGPPSREDPKSVDLAVQFVTRMLLAIPLRICVALAEQVLLKPLSEVVGSDKSKAQVVLACEARTQDVQRLEQLGCLLGISEWWSSSLLGKMEFPTEYCFTEPMGNDEDLFGPALAEEQEEEDEDAEESDDSDDDDDEPDIDAILSGDDDSAETEDGEAAGGTESSCDAPSAVDKNNSSSSVPKDTHAKSNKVDGDDDDGKDGSSDGEEEEDTDDDDDEEDSDGEGDGSSDEDETAPDGEDEKQAKGDNEDESVTEVGEAMEKILAVSEEEKELTREELCRNTVNMIRREEFGIGIELGETEQKLMLKQQERQGRSLQRLSKDLYSKDTHFVLELIQNADDNSYPEDVLPSVKFVIDHSGVKVMNNESGFEARNIQALCDVGKSTKTKHTIGYIGQKGIGFKSVFRVTGRPEVHSNGFHICFDVTSGPMGYILPHWVDPPPPPTEETEAAAGSAAWQTLIALPWTEEIKQQLHTHAARFNDIKPSLLLFLHRLKDITIDNRVDGQATSMMRKDLGDGEIQISHSGVTDRWLVVRKVLDASKVSAQMKAGVEVDSTEIALAFPLRGKGACQQAQMKPPMLPVFAFLPLRTYGFRFIIQGDFDVPSSREDVDRDSSWNQWLRSEIHTLFIEALDAFKSRPDLSALEALVQYLQFVPLEDEVVDFFKPVTTHILAQLRASKCLPVLSADKKGVSWKLPSQCVLVHDQLVREVVSPELLKHRLGLYYLHPQVSTTLDQALAAVLRVQPISSSHLLDIGGFIAHNWSGHGSPDQVMEIAKWLACVYRSLEDFQENTHVIEELSKLRVIPLADGSLVPLSDTTVFLLTEDAEPSSKQNTASMAGKRDPLRELRKDLSLIHSALTSTPDAEVNSQVVKLLLRTGVVKQLTPHDLVHSHIMPVLQSDDWKHKSREVLISYLAYIKTELERQPALMDASELRSAVRLATNHGVQSPEESSIHFSTAFGNKIDLPRFFPGVEWTLVDAAYLPPNPTVKDRQSWHSFLSSLGVVDFLRVQPVEVKFDKSTIHETPWALNRDLWPDSPDGYAVTDYKCEEFHQLVTTATEGTDKPNRPEQGVPHKQMSCLFEQLDTHWAREYSRFTPTQLRSSSGHVLKDVIETSFAIALKTLAWVPAESAVVSVAEDGQTAAVNSRQDLCRSSEVYVDCPLVRTRLAHTVKYLMVTPQQNSGFVNFLGIKTSVSPTEVTDVFLSWCKRDPDRPAAPATFCTTKTHILDLYQLFKDELSNKAAQDVFHNHPAIFVPVLQPGHPALTRGQLLVGRMMARDEVWWHDPTQLFSKYWQSLLDYKSPLGSRSTLLPFYGPRLEETFSTVVRPSWEPSTLHLAQLLQHVASTRTLHEEATLTDALCLFSHIGARLAKVGEKVSGVASYEASLRESELQPVVTQLRDYAVFPSQRLEWVNPTQQLLVQPDSPQLEAMFASKPGVHFLMTDLTKSATITSSQNLYLDAGSIQHFVSLFEEIKPLSDCVTTQEITSGFQQCVSGQIYLHQVVGLIQRFLYFVFPDVYRELRPDKAAALKQLMFVEVNQLEAKYELVGHPDIFVIQPEKCMVEGHKFYFHRAYVSSQTDINREIAKYFACGNQACVRELVSFLTQVVPILEGKSAESLESLLLRQQKKVRDLPAGEDVWEVPMPIIQKQEPEPQPEPDPEPQMVYGRALDSAHGNEAFAQGGSGDDSQSQGIKSWPPRSSMNVDQDQAKSKKNSDKSSTPAGMWPPPRPPNSERSARTLPSNIRVETEEETDVKEEQREMSHGEPGSDVKRKRKASDSLREGEPAVIKRFNSQTDEMSDKERDGQSRGQGGRRGSSGSQGPGGEGKDGDSDRERDGRARSQDNRGRDSDRERDGQARSQDSRGRDSERERDGRARSQDNRGRDSDRERDGRARSQDNRGRDSDRERDGPARSQDNREGSSGSYGQRHEGRDGDFKRSRDNTPSGMDATPSSSDTSQNFSASPQSKERRKLSFTIPLWSDSNLDLDYTDLSKEATASALPNLDLETTDQGDQDQVLEIGRWGEMLVLDYLLKLKSSDDSVEAVLWANAEGEKGMPWDFEIVYTGVSARTVYIEVKSTVSAEKEVFEVSPHQLKLALEEGPNFQVYRVFGAGKRQPRLVRVDNVAERMRTKQLKLYMLL